MRHLVVLLLLLPVCLSAQKKDVDIFGKGWYLSLTVQAEIKSEFTLTPFVTANDTLPRTGVITTFRRFPDTVRLNGNETVYFREPELQRDVRREQAVVNFLSSIRVHYRSNNRLEYTFGLFYQPTYEDLPRTNEFSGLPENFFYTSYGVKKISGGLVGDITYHLRKGKRLRPYLGLQSWFGATRSEALLVARVFPGLNEEINITENIVERFRINTIFDWDLDLLAGINYQLGDRLAIGIEAKLGQYLIPIPRAVQIRYRLGKVREERQ